MHYFYFVIWAILIALAILWLVLYKRDPISSWAWLMFIVFVPYVGPIVFLIFSQQRLERKAIKRRRRIEQQISGIDSNYVVKEEVSKYVTNFEEREVFHLARQISDYPLTDGNSVEIFPDPYKALQSMQEAIRQAKSFIHLEYYIIEYDEVTASLFECLLEAVERGVEIRILYDSLGSLFLKQTYFKKLIQAGAQTAGFLPLSFVRLNPNFRNHRKLLLVDGEIGFTGGTNLSRNYLGHRHEGTLHDYTAKVLGPAINQLQDVFAKDWHFTTEQDLFESKYYPQSSHAGKSTVQVLESGPDSTFLALQRAVLLAINIAKSSILLTTPYFIPDRSLLSALSIAALRGVKVKILLPYQNDVWIVRYASRSFYDELLECGVEIYEYLPRVLHAKMLTIDDRWSMVGSGNMDVRSFRLNFELNLLIYGQEITKQGTELFHKDLEQSVRINPSEFAKRPITSRILENVCRMLSPVL